MADTSFIGSTLSVQKPSSGNLPATLNEAGWEAGTYTEVGNIQDMGEFGDTHTPIEYNILKEGRVKRLPGAVDGGQVSISIVYDSNDGGQTIIKDANGTDGLHYFKVKDSDAETYYFAGTIADRRWAARNNSSVKMLTFTIYVTTTIYGPYSD